MLKNVPIFALKLAVTAGLIFWFVLPGIDFDTVIDRMDRLSPGLLLVAGALIFFQNAIVVAWRWEHVVAAIDRALPPWRLLKATIITLFFNQGTACESGSCVAWAARSVSPSGRF
jgi:uncharacterized membrane protein YbhN (UPF0104 family)